MKTLSGAGSRLTPESTTALPHGPVVHARIDTAALPDGNRTSDQVVGGSNPSGRATTCCIQSSDGPLHIVFESIRLICITDTTLPHATLPGKTICVPSCVPNHGGSAGALIVNDNKWSCALSQQPVGNRGQALRAADCLAPPRPNVRGDPCLRAVPTIRLSNCPQRIPLGGSPQG
jgi:hypothetical protein